MKHHRRAPHASRFLLATLGLAAAGFPVTVDPTFVQEAKLVGRADPLPDAVARFGNAVAVSGDTMVVGVPGKSVGDDGAAYVFVRSGTVWIEQQRLVASDGEESDRFGASVSISGDTVVIGAPYHRPIGFLSFPPGAVYVFVRSGTAWTEQQKLPLPEGIIYTFGYSLSVSGDTLVVLGYWVTPSYPAMLLGRAWVFVRSGTTWTQQQEIPSPSGRQIEGGVSISGDTVVMGTDNSQFGSLAGSADVFVRSGTTWTPQQQLMASGGGARNGFGRSVSIEGDTVVVGAPYDHAAVGVGAGSAYVFTRSEAGWTEQQKLTASDAQAYEHFGASVALSGDTAAVGASIEGYPPVPDQDAAYVFARSGTTWSEQQKLTPSDGTAFDSFGSSVSVSADTVLVGAPLHDLAGATDAGAAYVFARSGAAWSEQQKLTRGPDGVAGDRLGGSVSISGDTVVVGAASDDTAGGADAGAAYVFVFSGTGWTEQQKLTASDGAAFANFGRSVSLSGDTVAVGAPGAGGSGHAGSAYVFVRSGTVWTQQQKLTSGGSAGDRFGVSVSLEGDTVVVGADIPLSPGIGAAYVFVRSGTVWTEQQSLALPSDRKSGDRFGRSVALSGETLVVGAPLHNVGTEADAGAAYVFVRSGTVWTLEQKLTASDGAIGDQLGWSVALSGNTVLVGAPFPSGYNAPGSAYVFVRSGTTWTQQQRITPSDPTGGSRFGHSVSVSGEQAVVGSPFGLDAGGARTGAAYVFARAGTAWSQRQKLLASDAAASHAFGQSLSLSGDTVAVGAFGDDTPDGLNAGSAYVFRAPFVADLSLTLGDSPDPVVGLQPLAYTIAVGNGGPDPTGTARVVHLLPAGVVFQNAGGTGWACRQAGGVVTCTRPTLLLGPAPAITVTVTAPPTAQTLSSTATVSAAGDDPTPGNNSHTQTTTVTDAPAADLAVAKSDGGASASWGQPLTWTIIVSNLGPQAVTGATVSDGFPAGVAGVTWTCAASPGSSCPPSGSGDIAASVDLQPGGAAGFVATGVVQPGATTVTNTATVSAPAGTYDANPLNNRSTTITPPAPLAYFVVPPCRAVDTRTAQNPLSANSTRSFGVGGSCGVPADARAVAGNLIAVNPGQAGNLRVYPAGQPVPLASGLNFAAGRTRANNAIFALGTDGQANVRCDMPPGSTASTHFVLDVVGYFR